MIRWCVSSKFKCVSGRDVRGCGGWRALMGVFEHQMDFGGQLCIKVKMCINWDSANANA